MKTAKRNKAVKHFAGDAAFEKKLRDFSKACRDEEIREFVAAVDRSPHSVVWIELSMIEYQCLRACARKHNVGDVQEYVKGAALTMAESDIDVIGHEVGESK